MRFLAINLLPALMRCRRQFPNLAVVALILPFVAATAHANGTVPTKLFGIELGGIYDIGEPDKNDFGNIPIKRFAGIEAGPLSGYGIHYYFEPKTTYKAFEYLETRKNPEDQYYSTSFRLYLFPLIPATVTTAEQLNRAKLKWQVELISWAVLNVEDKSDAYFWAKDLCKTFETDLAIKPKTIDYYEQKWHQCIFSTGDRQLKVDSLYGKSIELSFSKEVSERRQDALEKVHRKIKANEQRPYELKK